MLHICLLLQLLEQACDANLILDDRVEFRDSYTLLLHGVTIAESYAVVVQCVVVYGYAEWSTDGILTTIALSDRVLLVVLAVEVELQVVDNLASLLWQTVFLYQWHYGKLDRSKSCWQLQYYACFAILELLLVVCVAHDREEHTVDTDRGLDNVWSVALVGLRIEVFDALA